MSSVPTRSPRRRSRSAVATLAIVVAGLANVLHAAEAPVVRIGFDGWYEVGRWTEAAVDLPEPAPAGSRLVVRSPDPDGNRVVYLGEKTAQPTTTLVALFASGRLDIPLEVEVMNGDETVVGPVRVTRAAARVVRQDVRLVATVGNPAGFDEYVGEQPRRSGSTSLASWRVVPLDSLDELPTKARGFEGLDTLVVADGFEIDPERLDALERWVWSGGHLVVATGENRPDYAASPFSTADWMPARTAETPLRLAKLDVLQLFAQENAVIPMLRPAVGTRLEVAAPEVDVLARVYGDPILVRSVHGFGHVTLLGVELHRPPLSEWSGGVESFVRRLLDVRPNLRKRAATTEDRRLAKSGVGDIGAQFNAAQDDFEGVNRSSRWTVMGLVLLYIVVIGPLDYLLVHRVLRKPEWTWATFPLVALVATVLGITTAASTNGSTLYVNQFEIVDVDAASGRLRGLQFATVYSPENRRYEVTASATPLGDGSGVEPVVNWLGLPVDSYGGMYREGGLRTGGLSYRETESADGFANVPVPVWSSQPFRTEWTEEAGPVVAVELADQGLGRLDGTVEIDLGFDLHDWVLVYGSRMYLPKRSGGERPSLRNGQTWHVNEQTVEPRDLRQYLTQTTSTRYEGKKDSQVDDRNIVTESLYDPLERDPRRLVEMLSFFEFAGGSAYTKLDNALLDRQDLSTLLNDGRAVLLGRCDEPLGRVQVDGKVVDAGRTTTFVRLVLPVRGR